jgi:molybdopterin synthase sulfur carrier subunit
MLIHIELKLFVTLAKYLPDGSDQYEIRENTTIQQLIELLDIPGDLVKLIFVNGRRQDRDYIIRNGDRIGFFPPVGGG